VPRYPELAPLDAVLARHVRPRLRGGA
jgi:hypothetical protein